MPLWLCLDTALDHCQAAVVERVGGESRVLGASSVPAAGDAEAIVTHADAALRQAGADFSQLSRVAVTVGPGSFTGVRVGIAYAKGVAVARAIPAVGVGTLEVIARGAIDDEATTGGATMPVLSAVDARHGCVFAGLYSATATEGAPPPARMEVATARRLADGYGARIVGPPTAVAALAAGEAVERLSLLALARCADGAVEGRAPRAQYLAPVDAAPQRHKALARA